MQLWAREWVGWTRLRDALAEGPSERRPRALPACTLATRPPRPLDASDPNRNQLPPTPWQVRGDPVPEASTAPGGKDRQRLTLPSLERAGSEGKEAG